MKGKNDKIKEAEKYLLDLGFDEPNTIWVFNDDKRLYYQLTKLMEDYCKHRWAVQLTLDSKYQVKHITGNTWHVLREGYLEFEGAKDECNEYLKSVLG